MRGIGGAGWVASLCALVLGMAVLAPPQMGCAAVDAGEGSDVEAYEAHIIMLGTHIANLEARLGAVESAALRADARACATPLSGEFGGVLPHERYYCCPDAVDHAEDVGREGAMAVVVPFVVRQLERVYAMLESWSESGKRPCACGGQPGRGRGGEWTEASNAGGASVADLVFYFSRDLENASDGMCTPTLSCAGLKRQLLESAKRGGEGCFRAVGFMSARISPELDVYTPRNSSGPARQFYALHQDQVFRARYGWFLYHEPDVVPVRDGWLAAVLAETQPGGSAFWMKGSIFRGRDMDPHVVNAWAKAERGRRDIERVASADGQVPTDVVTAAAIRVAAAGRNATAEGGQGVTRADAAVVAYLHDIARGKGRQTMGTWDDGTCEWAYMINGNALYALDPDFTSFLRKVEAAYPDEPFDVSVHRYRKAYRNWHVAKATAHRFLYSDLIHNLYGTPLLNLPALRKASPRTALVHVKQSARAPTTKTAQTVPL